MKVGGSPRWCLRTVPFESRGRCCNRELGGNINPGLNENSDRWKRDIMGSKYKILITSTSFFKAEPVPLQQLKEFNCEIIENPYGRPLKEDELIPLLVEVDGVIAGSDEFGEKVLKGSNRLKVISRYGVGIDNIDMEAAKRLGIFVINTPDVNTQAVADLTFGLILSVIGRFQKVAILSSLQSTVFTINILPITALGGFSIAEIVKSLRRKEISNDFYFGSLYPTSQDIRFFTLFLSKHFKQISEEQGIRWGKVWESEGIIKLKLSRDPGCRIWGTLTSRPTF